MAKSRELKEKVRQLEAKIAEQERKESELDESREELQQLAEEVFEETEPDDGEIATVAAKILRSDEDDAEDEARSDDENEYSDIDPGLRSTLAKFVREEMEKEAKKKETSMGLPEAPEEDDDDEVDELPKESAIQALKRMQAEKKAEKKAEKVDPKPKAEPRPKAGPKPKAEPKPKVEPKPKAEPKPKKPQTQASKLEEKMAAEQKAKPRAESKPKLEEAAVQISATIGHPDGPGKAYKYWSHKRSGYGITPDYWAAKQIGGDLLEVVWVWYKNGSIHHPLDEEEMRKFLPH